MKNILVPRPRPSRSLLTSFVGVALLFSACATQSKSDDAIIDTEPGNEISFLEAGSEPPVPLSDEELQRLSEGPGRNAKAAAAHGLLSLQSFDEVGTGEGLVIGLWDGGGVLDTHQEFDSSRVINGSDIERVHWHATHVAGTLAAVGIEGFDEARGMAPDASILVMNYCGNIRQEIETAYDQYPNLAVTNHSYAQRFKRGDYTRLSRTFDDLVRDRPEAVLVVAAGNSGCGPTSGFDCSAPEEDGREYGSIDAPGTARNVVTVGSMSDLPYGLEVENVRLLRFDPLYGDIPVEPYSGVGPTRDGRIKPDVVANGDRLYSTFSEFPQEFDCTQPPAYPAPQTCNSVDPSGEETGECYKSDSGTSMATPTVSGIVTVLQEVALKESALERLLSALEVRALLIHSAVSVDSKPKYKYGWGAVSAKRAVDHLRSWSVSESLTGSSHYVALAEVPTSSTWKVQRVKNDRGKLLPVRITLAWNDAPGTSLIHDLDLVLREIESGAEIRPWTLNPNEPTAPAERAVNDVDNVERIDLALDEFVSGQFELVVQNPGGASTDAVLLISGLELE